MLFGISKANLAWISAIVLGIVAIAVGAAGYTVYHKRRMLRRVSSKDLDKEPPSTLQPVLDENGEPTPGTVIVPLTTKYAAVMGLFRGPLGGAGTAKKHKSRARIPINMTLAFQEPPPGVTDAQPGAVIIPKSLHAK